jgi:D-alanine-D-alanine ligase-like ATP-grasp enzyme
VAQDSLKKKCVYCGDAPTNHTLHYINTSIDLFFSSLVPKKEKSGSHFLDPERSPLVRVVGRAVAGLMGSLRMLRFSDDVDDAVSERTKVIWREAQVRGITMQQVLVFGLKREESRALLPQKKGLENDNRLKRKWEYFQSIPIPRWAIQPSSTWVDDKSTFKKNFKKAGLPIADGKAVRTYAQALAAFREFATPVIAKPREGSRARHTTVSITSEEELARAYARAHQLCPDVMIEQYITGTLYRATCVGKKLIGVIEFVKPATVADGIKTTEQLRIAHNAHKKFENLTDVKDDAWFRDALSHQGLTPESVPPAGTHVLLSEHSERPNGGYFIDITDDIPDSTKAEIERAAKVCEIEVIGFDIISKNLKDTREKFTFIEGNSLPYIELHHMPYEGKVRNVAGAVWDLWFA